GDMGTAGVTNWDATNEAQILSVAQYNAVLAAGIDLAAGDKVKLVDTGANLATVLGTPLAANGVDVLDASDDQLSISLSELNGLGAVVLTKQDIVTLVDTGANLA